MRRLVWIMAVPFLIGVGPFGSGPAESVFDNTATPWPLSSQISAQNYDQGGQGIGYNVPTPNGGCLQSSAYRPDTVNFKVSTAGPAYQLCTATGNWFRYMMGVSTSGGPYVLNLVASDAALGPAPTWSVLIDNVNVATVGVALTGDYSVFATNTSGQFNMSPGNHIVKLVAATGDSVGGAGDISSFNISQASGTPCVYGPNVATIPAPAIEAGYLTCVVNADFTDNTGASGGSGWVMRDKTTWLNQCKGTQTWGLFWLVYDDHEELNQDEDGPVACNRANIIQDGGVNVLNYTFSASDIGVNHTGISLDWPLCGNACLGLRPAMPFTWYVEYTYKLASGASQPSTSIVSAIEAASVFDSGPPQAGGALDGVFLEAQSNNAGANTGIDNYSVPSFGNIFGWGINPWFPDLTNYNTIGYLVTSDGVSSMSFCVYYQNAPLLSGTRNGGWDGTNCGHVPHFSASELNDHDTRIELWIGTLSNGGTTSVNVKSMRVFACANYRAGNCINPVVFH